MAKKTQHKKKGPVAKKVEVHSQQLLEHLNRLQFDLLEGKFDSVLRISQILIGYLPSSSPHLPEVLLKRGTALMEMGEYDEAYDVLSRAAKLAPDDGFLLYIYSQSCKYTHRLAKASVAIEEAVTLEPALLKNRNTKKELNSIRKTIQNVIKLSGKDFTFEQLIEQEELEITGLRLVKEHKLEEAEALFRQVIAMGDIMIAPHNNLAHCLLRRGKFKEAEQELLIALKMDRRNPVARNNLPVVREAIKTGKIPEFSGVYNPSIGQITDIQPTHSNLPTGSDFVPD